jgi:hypothetical protein
MKHQMHYWAVYTQCHSLHKLYSNTLLEQQAATAAAAAAAGGLMSLLLPARRTACAIAC